MTKTAEFSLSMALVLVMSLPASILSAETVDATRARIDLASIAPPTSETRACWARYSTNGAQARNGVIEEVAFRVPCPEVMGQSFMETLQRALIARGFHEGPVTGRPDAQTRAAVQAFQRENGFNSPILTLETAQRLGLLPINLTRN